MATGLAFASFGDFWPLLVVAFVGTLNPSAGDVSVFLPLEQALLARRRRRTATAPRCSPATAWSARWLGAVGTLLGRRWPTCWPPVSACRCLPRSRRCSSSTRSSVSRRPDLPSAALGRRLGARRPPSVDAARPVAPHRLSARGAVQPRRLRRRPRRPVAPGALAARGASACRWRSAAQLFFWSGLLTALSYLAAVPLARRIGLVNTMVFTHLPANLCLIAVPFVPELWQRRCVAAGAQPAVADGCADAHLLRHGRGHPGRARRPRRA